MFYRLYICTEKKETNDDLLEVNSISFLLKQKNIETIKKIETTGIQQFFKDVKQCREIYSDRIFPFNIFFYRKIWNCRNGKPVIFTNDELKKLISTGITELENNDFIAKTIFHNIICGKYLEIMPYYIEYLRNDLLKNIIVNIFIDVDLNFAKYCFDNKSYLNKFISRNNFLVLNEFSKIIYEEKYEQKLQKFIINLYSYFMNYMDQEKSKNQIIFDLNTISHKFYSYDISFYEKFISELKAFDEFLYDSKTKKLKKIGHDEIKVCLAIVYKNFNDAANYFVKGSEINQIINILHFLYHIFFKYCLENFIVEISTLKGDKIIFNHDLEKKQVIEISKYSNNIFLEGIFNAYKIKDVYIISNLMKIDTCFLELILSQENHKIDLEKSLILEFEHKQYMDKIYTISLYNFLKSLRNTKHSIAFQKFIKKYETGKYIIEKKIDLSDAIGVFYVRYIFKESYKKILLTEINHEEYKKYYEKICNIFKPEVSHHEIFFSDIFSEISNYKFSVRNTIDYVKKIFSDLQSKIEVDCYIFETDNDFIDNNITSLGLIFPKFHLIGRICGLRFDIQFKIIIIIIHDFYLLTFMDSETVPTFHDIDDINFEVNKPRLPSGSISISTTQRFYLKFHKLFFIYSKLEHDPVKKTIIFDDQMFYLVHGMMYVNKFPNELVFIKLENCSLLEMEKCSHIIFENHSTRKTINFFKCIAFVDIKFNCSIYKINIEKCKFKTLFFDLAKNQPDYLFLKECKGDVYFSKLNISNSQSESTISILHYIKNQLLKIIFYNLYDNLELMNNMDVVLISQCILYLSIEIFFSKLEISECTGSIYFVSADNAFVTGLIEVQNESLIKMEKLNGVYFFTFQQVIFYSSPEYNFSNHKNFKYKMQDCTIIL